MLYPARCMLVKCCDMCISVVVYSFCAARPEFMRFLIIRSPHTRTVDRTGVVSLSGSFDAVNLQATGITNTYIGGVGSSVNVGLSGISNVYLAPTSSSVKITGRWVEKEGRGQLCPLGGVVDTWGLANGS